MEASASGLKGLCSCSSWSIGEVDEREDGVETVQEGDGLGGLGDVLGGTGLAACSGIGGRACGLVGVLGLGAFGDVVVDRCVDRDGSADAGGLEAGGGVEGGHLHVEEVPVPGVGYSWERVEEGVSRRRRARRARRR